MTERPHGVTVHLDRLLAERDMTLTQLSEEVGVTLANLSILKNGHARAIRFTTLTRLCRVLGCQPGDLLTIEPPHDRADRRAPARDARSVRRRRPSDAPSDVHSRPPSP